MITIAVCGKDSKMNRWLKGKLEQWLQEYFAAHKTEVYASGRALLHEAEEGKKFDLVFYGM